MKIRNLSLTPAVASVSLFAASISWSQTSTGWSGGTSSDMQTGSNWDNGIGSNNNLFIGDRWNTNGRTGSTTLNNASNYSGYRLNFQNLASNQTFTVQGSQITLFDFNLGALSPGVINSSNVNQIINAPLVFNPGNNGVSLIQANGATGGNLTFGGTLSLDANGTGNQLRISGANANTVTFGGAISAVGGNSVVVSQGSSNITVVYNAANTYNGDTFVDSGTLQFGTALSSAGSANNSILRLGQNSADSPAATINLATTAGGVNVGSLIVIRPSSSGGQGTRTLSSSNTSGTNTFSGNVILDAVATATSTNAGGTLAFTGSTLQLKTFGLLVNGAGNTTISNLISSTGAGNALTKSGAGTLTLTNTSNGYTGATNISAGTLSLTGSGRLSGTTSVVMTGGTLLLSATDSIGAASFTTGGATIRLNPTSTFSEEVGSLSLTSGTTIIDFGTNGVGNNILKFTTPTLAAGTLQVWNWSGTLISGGGTDQLFFTAGSNPSNVQFYSGDGPDGAGSINLGMGVQQLGGELVPVPEASSLLAALSLMGLAFRRDGRHRRRAGR